MKTQHKGNEYGTYPQQVLLSTERFQNYVTFCPEYFESTQPTKQDQERERQQKWPVDLEIVFFRAAMTEANGEPVTPPPPRNGSC